MVTANLFESVRAGLIPESEDLLKEDSTTLVWSATLDDSTAIVAKVYKHRGVWNSLRARATRYRVQREHDTLRHLDRLGVPCTRSVAWHAGYSRRSGFFELLLVEEVPGAAALDIWLRRGGSAKVVPSAFAAVRRMHDAGVLHQSLVTRNLIVRQQPGEEPACLIMDVATARVFRQSVTVSHLAWLELADLYYSLSCDGTSADTALSAYGLDSDAAGRLRSAVSHHPHGKLRRRLRDAQARAGLIAGSLSRNRRPPRG